MATTTPNLQLTKPAATDFYDVAVGNENLDKIDTKFGSIDETVTTLESDVGAILAELPKKADVEVTVTEEITTSGTWTVPNGVYKIHVMCIGGGGSGACDAPNNVGLGGGGGYLAEGDFDVTPGANLTVTIGAGGTQVTSQTGNNGGATSVTYSSTTLLSAAGGEGGKGRDESTNTPGHAGNGGTGGGSAVRNDSSSYAYPAGNGQYGGCGGSAYSKGASNGQGTRTAYGGQSAMDDGNYPAYGGGGGGGMNGGNGGNGAARGASSNSAAAGGGGGGYGTTKKAGDGKLGTGSGGKGGTGYGAGGGGGATYASTTGSAGAGAPGICVIKYKAVTV